MVQVKKCFYTCLVSVIVSITTLTYYKLSTTIIPDYLKLRFEIERELRTTLFFRYTHEGKQFSRHFNSLKPEVDDNGMDLAFEVINNQSILPPSARIRARKIFKEKPLVIWATEWHMTPIKDVVDLLTPFGVTVKNYNLDPYRCAWQDCNAKKNLKVLTSDNVLDIEPPIQENYLEAYRDDAEMRSVDVVYCSYPASLCEVYLSLNKSVLVIATTRYDVGRYTVERWNKLNENFRILARNPWSIFGGNNLYDARYIKYYTGIKTRHIPSMCDYTGTEYSNQISDFMLMRRRDRGFTKIFFAEFNAAKTLMNISCSLVEMTNHEFSQVAKYRGIVHVPYQISVMSIFEQYRMNIPMFVPSPDLLAKWQVEHYIMPERSFNGAFFNERPSKSIIEPDASQKHIPDPKNELDFNSTRYWMKFADFYKVMPYGVMYNSIPHLVRILDEITNAELLDISSKMREYNIQFKKKLLRKWRKILLEYAKNSPNHPH